MDDETLKVIGFSHQSTLWSSPGRGHAQDGKLNFDTLHALDDDAVKVQLTRLKGLGAWSADIYLLMALGRPDAWPSGDLALAVAAQRIKRLSNRPTPSDLMQMAENWRPWRAIAARILWHYYLSQRSIPKARREFASRCQAPGPPGFGHHQFSSAWGGWTAGLMRWAATARARSPLGQASGLPGP